MKQSKIYVKFIIICIAILIGFIGIFLVTDKIVKAETLTEYYKINLPNELLPTPQTQYNITSDGVNNQTNTGENIFTSENNTVSIYQLRIVPGNSYNWFIIVCRLTDGQTANWYISTQNNNSFENHTIIFNIEQSIKTALGITENNEILNIKWVKNQTNYNSLLENNTEQNINIFNKFFQYYSDTIQLDTPELTAIYNTITWNYIENAEYYNIFMNGNIIGQTIYNQWVVSANGNYTIQACTTLEGYSNSDISQVIQITSFNDLIGNGWNFYTLIGAVLDSELILVKSFLNYTVWGINLFQTLQIILTMCLVILIIKKFVVKG